jgi:kexin
MDTRLYQMVMAAGFLVRALVLVLGCLVMAGAGGAAEQLAAGPQRITDGGQVRVFNLALDEWLERGPAGGLRQFSAVRSRAEVCDAAAVRQSVTGREVCLVLCEEGVLRDRFTRRFLTRDVLVQLRPGAGFPAAAVPAVAWRAVAGMAGWWLVEARGPDGALRLAEALRGEPGVAWAEPQLARFRERKFLPHDPFLPQQWHLRNTGQFGGVPGVDINVTGVWDSWRGGGVVIGIVDDGVEGTHADLAANFRSALSTNLGGNAFSPYSDTHVTPVAGLAAARGNNAVGVCGVAFEAGLADVRLLGSVVADANDRAAMLHRNDAIQIKNNSWGADDGTGVLDGPGPLMAAGLAEGVSTGRDGRGEVYFFAGGNGRAYGEDVNYDGFANSVFVSAIGAVDDQGAQASYSEPGACLVVVAPSRGGSSCSGRPGLASTDLTGSYGRNPGAVCEPTDWDFTQTFGGTSGAAPITAGVAALMLQANPSLGWRDVKEILLRSATRIQPGDADWQTNAAGVAHNHRFGGGLVNAGAAVALATNWAKLDALAKVALLLTNLNTAVPDRDPNGLTFALVVTNAGFRVEHAALTVKLPHQRFGDLAITLTSPAGTRSRLAETHNTSGAGYLGWTLTSVRHWGEVAQGTWTAQVADLVSGNTGSVVALQLELLGSTPAAMLTVSGTGSHRACILQAAAPGWRYVLQSASDLASWTDGACATVGTDGQAVFPLTNAPSFRQFYRARLQP